MTYKDFLTCVLVDLIKNKNHERFHGICSVSSCYKYLNDEYNPHRKRLGYQIHDDLCPGNSYLDKSFMFRVKHGNLLPYWLLTPTMRTNMRIAYIKSLIAKES